MVVKQIDLPNACETEGTGVAFAQSAKAHDSHGSDDPEPLRVLRDRVEAQQTAGKLAKAGVRFAFQSGSLTNISDLLVNARRSIENGLQATDALRAFTIWPAEIFGVENQLGSIETGKIANLTVMRGDLFARDSRVAHIFIDGRQIDLRPTAVGGPARAPI